MSTTQKKIEQLSRALFPRYGIKDVASLVSTIVRYRGDEGHVKIWRPDGGWNWFRAPGSTTVTPSLVTLRFPADAHRNAARAREDIYRQLEDASLSTMSEEELEAMTGQHSRARPRKSSIQLESEISQALAEDA